MPDKAPQYEELGKIGQGSFGQVFKVRYKVNNKIYARKEVKWGEMVPKLRKILRDEVRLLLTIKHPNVVGYRQAVDDPINQKLHIYMEYCAFGDLKQYIHRVAQEKKMIGEDRVWSILEQLVMALFRCHNGYNHHRDLAGAHGSVLYGDGFRFYHRDLKPENIFIDDSTDSIKLGDFGLCGLLEPGERMRTTFVGTYPYMSPEMLKCLPYSEKSETWGLGCILHELASRDVTFCPKGTDDSEIFELISSGQYPPIPGCYSKDLHQVIGACLRLDPEKRPSMEDIANHPCVVKARGERELRAVQGRRNEAFSQKVQALETRCQESTVKLQMCEKVINAQEESLRIQKARLNHFEKIESKNQAGAKVLAKVQRIRSLRLKTKGRELARKERELSKREGSVSLMEVLAASAAGLNIAKNQVPKEMGGSEAQSDTAAAKDVGEGSKFTAMDKEEEDADGYMLFGDGDGEETEEDEPDELYERDNDSEWGYTRTEPRSE